MSQLLQISSQKAACQLLTESIEAARDPANVTADECFGGPALRVQLMPSTYVYVPMGGEYFLADNRMPIFESARELWLVALDSYRCKGQLVIVCDLLQEVGHARLIAEHGGDA
jgi:hypothetical protein